ncbi:MAG TPA: hypothetical protein VMY35_05355, partial [Phycisphaerae bacterium]|nr:hypothetical protein [Phycisphaerae bacterium]
RRPADNGHAGTLHQSFTAFEPTFVDMKKVGDPLDEEAARGRPAAQDVGQLLRGNADLRGKIFFLAANQAL